MQHAIMQLSLVTGQKISAHQRPDPEITYQIRDEPDEPMPENTPMHPQYAPPAPMDVECGPQGLRSEITYSGGPTLLSFFICYLSL
jgi:hypothetical protein